MQQPTDRARPDRATARSIRDERRRPGTDRGRRSLWSRFSKQWSSRFPDMGADILGLLLLGGLLAGVLAYIVALPPTSLAFDLADPPANVTLRGFYGPERNDAFSFRWSRPAASLSLPVSAPADYRLVVGMGDNPALVSGRTARLYANGRDLGTVTLGATPQETAFLVRLDSRGWLESGRALHLEIASAALVPPGDPRPLGPLLTQVRLEPLARRFPPGFAFGPPILLLLIVARFLQGVGVRHGRLLLTLLALLAALAGCVAIRRADALALLITTGQPVSLGVLLPLLLALPLLSTVRGDDEAAQVSARPAWLPWLPLAGLLLAGAVLRGYRLVELLPFLGDSGRDALVMRRMLVGHVLPTLGPWASVGNFSRGPAYFYLLYLPFRLVAGHAAAAAVVSAIADCCAIVLFFLVGRRLASPWVGLTAAGLWAVAPLALLFARMGWNPNPLPCFTLLIVYGLLRIARGDGRLLLLVAPAWSIAWQLHDQALLLLPPIALIWLWLRPRIAPKYYAGAAALTLLTLAPYLAGEFGRGFANTRTMVAYMRGSQGGSGSARNVPLHLTQVAQHFDLLLPGTPGDWLHWAMRTVALLGLLALASRVRARTTRPEAIVVACWLLVVPLYGFWPGAVYYHYLLIGFPLPFLALGLGVDLLRRVRLAGRTLAPLLAALLVALVSTGAFTAFVGLRNSPPGTYAIAERIVDRILADAGNAPFTFRYVGAWSYEATAYDYLFAYRGRGSVEGPDLPTYTVFTPINAGDGRRYRGTVVGDAKIVRTDLERPQSGLNLLIDEGFWAYRQLPAPVYVIPARPGWAISIPSAAQIEATDDGRTALGLVRAAAGQVATAEQVVPVESERRYLVSFEYRTRPQGGALAGQPVQFLIADATGALRATAPDETQPPPPLSEGWASHSFVAVVPAGGATATVRLANPGTAEIWFRNVAVRELPASAAAR